MELLSLTWESVNFEGRSIHIQSAHKGGPVRREVPLHPQIITQMQIWHDEDKKLFAKDKIKDHDISIVHFRKRMIKKIQNHGPLPSRQQKSAGGSGRMT